MELNGLKINLLGDSITQGVGASSNETCYVSMIGKLSGAVCRNYGISGTRIARRRVPYEIPQFDQDFPSRVDSMDKDADIVIVFGGTNDFGHGDAPLGKMEDRTVWSFYGALHVLYNALLKRFPNSKIVVLTPMKRHEEKRDGKTLPPFVQAVREVAAYYHLPVLDLYRDLPVDLHDPQMEAKYIPDGLHPNDGGHLMLAKTIINYLKDM